MTSRRIIVFFVSFLLISLSFVRCLGTGAGLDAAGVASGCSASSLENDWSSDVNGLIDDGPVDIPVSIAKSDQTPDATTFNLASGSGSYLVNSNRARPLLTTPDSSTSSDVVGTVSFYLQDRSCQLVGVYFEGRLIQTLTGDENNGCLYEVDVAENLVDKIVSYVTFADASETSMNATASVPIITRLNNPINLIDDHSLTVLVSDVPQSEVFAVMNAEPGSGVVDSVYEVFYATTLDGESQIWTIPAVGGVTEKFADGFENNLVSIQVGGNNLLARDNTDDVLEIFDIDSTNLTPQSLNLSVFLDSHSDYDLHPNGSYLAYDREVSDDRQAIYIVDLESGEELAQIPDDIDEIDLGDVQSAWMNPSLLGLISHVDGTYKILMVDASIYIQNEPNQLVPVLGTDTPIADPIGSMSGTATLFFRCASDEGYWNLCYMRQDEEEMHTAVDLGEDILDYRFTSDGSSSVIFSVDTDPPSIGAYHIASDTTTFISPGYEPMPIAGLRNNMAYLYDLDNTRQIGILNLPDSLTSDTVELSLRMGNTDIEPGQSSRTRVFGGMPPYTFSVSSGLGSVNAATGRYVSSNSEETATIAVTDANGNTATADLPVIGGCPSDDNLEGSKNDCWESYKLDHSSGGGHDITVSQDDAFYETYITESFATEYGMTVNGGSGAAYKLTDNGGSGIPYLAQTSDLETMAIAAAFDTENIHSGNFIGLSFASDTGGNFLYSAGYTENLIKQTAVTSAGEETPVQFAYSNPHTYICLGKDGDTYTMSTSQDGLVWTLVQTITLENIASTYTVGVWFADLNAPITQPLVSKVESVQFNKSSASCPTVTLYE